VKTTLVHTAIVAAMLLVGFASPTLGRTWTDITGKHEVEGEFVQASGEWIQIKTSAGKLLPLKIKRLSLPDQKHIKELIEKKPEPKNGGGAAQKEGPKPERLKPEPRPAKRTGQFKTPLKEHSPRGHFGREIVPRTNTHKDYLKNLQNEFKDKPVPEYFYDVTKEQFEFFIPKSYDGELPFGLLVFLSRDDNGAPPKEWLPILEKHRLIYIGPHKANHFERRQIPMGLDAVHHAVKEYNIDPSRIYAGGFERGGLGASALALAYPDIFAGAEIHSGAGYCREIRKNPKDTIKPKFVPVDRNLFSLAMKNGRYVFFGVQGDPGRMQSQLVAFNMKSDGFRQVTPFTDMPVGTNPLDATWFEKGIQALDQPLTVGLKEKYDQGVKWHDENKNWGMALPALRMAACHGTDQTFAKDAKERYLDLAARYEKDLAAIEDRVKFGDTANANKLLNEFQKRWKPACFADAQRLTLAIRQKRAPKRP